jgi:cytochrome c peroxidase
MKTLRTLFLMSILGLAATLYSCEISELESRDSYLDLPSKTYNYNIGVNDGLPTLGRVLFYDPRVSANNVASCASCHKQELAFSDNKAFSKGFKGELTERNSMPIQNIVSTAFPFGVEISSGGSFNSTSLFWDGRKEDILKMVLDPIQNHIEMGVNNLEDLENKIASISDYKPLFIDAFGSAEINQSRIAKALSAFIVSIRSTQSKFDQSLLNGTGNFSSSEQFGKELFFSTYNCNSCHQLQEPVNGYQTAATVAGVGETGGFADIGLDENPTDGGAFRKTGLESDKGKFKIPSLRNIALTGPYMHDGRFETLDEVIDHYSNGIDNSANLDVRLRDENGNAKRFNIPTSDKYAIIAFLNTMTDNSLLYDKKFSNPFKVR